MAVISLPLRFVKVRGIPTRVTACVPCDIGFRSGKDQTRPVYQTTKTEERHAEHATTPQYANAMY